MPDNMKAVLYARVSSDRQEQEDTVQSQLGELRQHLRTPGSPTGRSSSTKATPETIWSGLPWTG